MRKKHRQKGVVGQRKQYQNIHHTDEAGAAFEEGNDSSRSLC